MPQWLMASRSPLTVARQRRIDTGFPAPVRLFSWSPSMCLEAGAFKSQAQVSSSDWECREHDQRPRGPPPPLLGLQGRLASGGVKAEPVQNLKTGANSHVDAFRICRRELTGT